MKRLIYFLVEVVIVEVIVGWFFEIYSGYEYDCVDSLTQHIGLSMSMIFQ